MSKYNPVTNTDAFTLRMSKSKTDSLLCIANNNEVKYKNHVESSVPQCSGEKSEIAMSRFMNDVHNDITALNTKSIQRSYDFKSCKENLPSGYRSSYHEDIENVHSEKHSISLFEDGTNEIDKRCSESNHQYEDGSLENIVRELNVSESGSEENIDSSFTTNNNYITVVDESIERPDISVVSNSQKSNRFPSNYIKSFSKKPSEIITISDTSDDDLEEIVHSDIISNSFQLYQDNAKDNLQNPTVNNNIKIQNKDSETENSVMDASTYKTIHLQNNEQIISTKCNSLKTSISNSDIHIECINNSTIAKSQKKRKPIFPRIMLSQIIENRQQSQKTQSLKHHQFSQPTVRQTTNSSQNVMRKTQSDILKDVVEKTSNLNIRKSKSESSLTFHKKVIKSSPKKSEQFKELEQTTFQNRLEELQNAYNIMNNISNNNYHNGNVSNNSDIANETTQSIPNELRLLNTDQNIEMLKKNRKDTTQFISPKIIRTPKKKNLYNPLNPSAHSDLNSHEKSPSSSLIAVHPCLILNSPTCENDRNRILNQLKTSTKRKKMKKKTNNRPKTPPVNELYQVPKIQIERSDLITFSYKTLQNSQEQRKNNKSVYSDFTDSQTLNETKSKKEKIVRKRKSKKRPLDVSKTLSANNLVERQDNNDEPINKITKRTSADRNSNTNIKNSLSEVPKRVTKHGREVPLVCYKELDESCDISVCTEDNNNNYSEVDQCDKSIGVNENDITHLTSDSVLNMLIIEVDKNIQKPWNLSLSLSDLESIASCKSSSREHKKKDDKLLDNVTNEQCLETNSNNASFKSSDFMNNNSSFDKEANNYNDDLAKRVISSMDKIIETLREHNVEEGCRSEYTSIANSNVLSHTTQVGVTTDSFVISSNSSTKNKGDSFQSNKNQSEELVEQTINRIASNEKDIFMKYTENATHQSKSSEENMNISKNKDANMLEIPNNLGSEINPVTTTNEIITASEKINSLEFSLKQPAASLKNKSMPQTVENKIASPVASSEVFTLNSRRKVKSKKRVKPSSVNKKVLRKKSVKTNNTKDTELLVKKISETNNYNEKTTNIPEIVYELSSDSDTDIPRTDCTRSITSDIIPNMIFNEYSAKASSGYPSDITERWIEMNRQYAINMTMNKSLTINTETNYFSVSADVNDCESYCITNQNDNNDDETYIKPVSLSVTNSGTPKNYSSAVSSNHQTLSHTSYSSPSHYHSLDEDEQHSANEDCIQQIQGKGTENNLLIYSQNNSSSYNNNSEIVGIKAGCKVKSYMTSNIIKHNNMHYGDTSASEISHECGKSLKTNTNSQKSNFISEIILSSQNSLSRSDTISTLNSSDTENYFSTVSVDNMLSIENYTTKCSNISSDNSNCGDHNSNTSFESFHPHLRRGRISASSHHSELEKHVESSTIIQPINFSLSDIEENELSERDKAFDQQG